MTTATILRALRRAWRAVAALPGWLWFVLLATIALLEQLRVRRQLADERRRRELERDAAAAERLAAERAALAQGQRIEARDVATRVHDAAAERIQKDDAVISTSAAKGLDALSDEANRTFGGPR